MAWIREVFLTVLNMSVTAGITILVILAVRAVFRKAPRKYLYVLWLVAALRLVCPWAPESRMSLFNLNLLQPAESAGGAQMWYAPAEAETSGGNTGEDVAGGDQNSGAAADIPSSEGIQRAALHAPAENALFTVPGGVCARNFFKDVHAALYAAERGLFTYDIPRPRGS